MNGMDQLEALNPIPDRRGNPGPLDAGWSPRRNLRSGAVLALAAAIVIVGALSIRGLNRAEVDVAAGAPPTPEPVTIVDLDLGFYAVAKPWAGVLDTTDSANDDTGRYTIPVFREPNGAPQTLLYENKVLGVDRPFALVNDAHAGGALVVRVLARSSDDKWLKVQAPILPHDQFVWVDGSEFEVEFTSRRIEIDIAGPGALRLLQDDDVLIETSIVHGRAGRETPTHLTYIENGVAGPLLGPAYGDTVLSLASFSEVLGSFGANAGLPANYLHGTNQPELMGQRISSGEIRVPNPTLAELLELAGPGTPVVLYDGDSGADKRDDIVNREPTLARTTRFTQARDGAASPLAPMPKLWQWCENDDGPPLCFVEN